MFPFPSGFHASRSDRFRGFKYCDVPRILLYAFFEADRHDLSNVSVYWSCFDFLHNNRSTLIRLLNVAQCRFLRCVTVISPHLVQGSIQDVIPCTSPSIRESRYSIRKRERLRAYTIPFDCPNLDRADRPKVRQCGMLNS